MKAARALAVSAMVLTLQAASPAGATDPSEYRPADHPILFVHGYGGSPFGWDAMANRFRADGWPDTHLDQWSYDSRQSNTTTAHQLSAEIERLRAATGADQVDVITHSMGGLPARYYTKDPDGAERIDAWASLGSPHHGTASADLCFDTSCTEMRHGSDYLRALNAGDETPGRVRYGTWRSPCDMVIRPERSAALAGAVNTRTRCLSHDGLIRDAGVYAQTRDMVTG